MRDEPTTMTASILVRQENEDAVGYVVMMTGKPFRVATLSIEVDTTSEEWREDFRALCQKIVDEKFAAQGMKATWVHPRDRRVNADAPAVAR